MNAERYPVDFEALNRGDVIPAERIEEIYAVSRSEQAFRFAAMGLAEEIEKFFREVRNDEVIVKHDNDSLRVLTHPQQAIEARRRAASMVRGFGRAIYKGAGVDASQLADEERNRHARFLQVGSWRLQQMRKAPPPQLGQ